MAESSSMNNNGRITQTPERKPRKRERCSICDERGHSSDDCPEEQSVQEMYEHQRTKAKLKFEHYKYVPVTVTTPGKRCDECKTERTQDGIGSYEKGEKDSCPCSKPSPETKPIKDFKELNLDQQVYTNIVNDYRCGFKVPTPIQRYALPIISEGFDVMGCAQTGTGKTAAYMIPVITLVKEKGFRKTRVGWDEPQKPEVLIVAPTRELAQQIHSEALKLALNMRHPCGIKVVYGGARTKFQRDKIRQGCNILIGTPGRIKHFIKDYTISMERTEILVLDEADKMIDDGFRSELELIVGLTEMPKIEHRQTMLFSATFRSDLQDLAVDIMKPDFRLIEAGIIGSAQPKVTQMFERVQDGSQKVHRLYKILLDIHAWDEKTFLNCNCWKTRRHRNYDRGNKPVIGDFFLHVLGQCSKSKTLIFVETKREAGDLADGISNFLHERFGSRFMTKPEFKSYYNQGDDHNLIENFGAISFHANKEQYDRETAVEKFNSGTYPILVATNVAARGLDFENVTRVINYNLPCNLSEFKKYWEQDTLALKEGKIKKRPVRNQFEEYIHRIGRTGRAGKEGESISFFQVDKDSHLAIPIVRMLGDAQQDVPEWLFEIAEEQCSIARAGKKKRGKGGPSSQGTQGSAVKKEWDGKHGPGENELWSEQPENEP